MALAWHGRHRRRQVSLCRPGPFQGKGCEPSGTQHSCFGNCAELSLDVSKGTWIFAVLVCRPKDSFTGMQDAIA